MPANKILLAYSVLRTKSPTNKIYIFACRIVIVLLAYFAPINKCLFMCSIRWGKNIIAYSIATNEKLFACLVLAIFFSDFIEV